MADTFIPPQSVADNARMALDVRESKPASQRGMTAVGLARANQLANRKPISLETVQRMVAYFDRHEIDKQGSTWDEKGKGYQAWYGWGGDEGRVWANRILMENKMTIKASRRHSEADMEALRVAAHHAKQTMKALRTVGYDGVKPKSIKALDESVSLTERQIAMYDTYEALVEEYGAFDQGIGANGAHYGAGDMNPFMDEGIMCASCVFYMEGKCEIVQGDIDPEGICKLWIIPESALNLVSAEEIPEETPEEMPMEESVPAPVKPMAEATAAIEDRETTPAQREEMPAGDFVIPETRNFPIVTPEDVDAAVSSWGRYRGDVSFETFKDRLIQLALVKGEEFFSRIPQAWKDEMETDSLDDSAIMNAEAVKRYVRRLLGAK